jgi:hypothetical protein
MMAASRLAGRRSLLVEGVSKISPKIRSTRGDGAGPTWTPAPPEYLAILEPYSRKTSSITDLEVAAS